MKAEYNVSKYDKQIEKCLQPCRWSSRAFDSLNKVKCGLNGRESVIFIPFFS